MFFFSTGDLTNYLSSRISNYFDFTSLLWMAKPQNGTSGTSLIFSCPVQHRQLLNVKATVNLLCLWYRTNCGASDYRHRIINYLSCSARLAESNYHVRSLDCLSYYRVTFLQTLHWTWMHLSLKSFQRINEEYSSVVSILT